MALETLYIIEGIFSLAFVIVSFIIGLKIISRYFLHKQKLLIYVGISIIVISETWWPSSISMLVGLINGVGINPQLYILLGVVLIPIVILFWLAAFTEMLYKDKKKLILLIFLIEGIIFEIYFLSTLFTDPSLLGEMQSPVNMKYKGVVIVYLLVHLIIMLITGVIFGLESLKSENKEIKLKGKLIIIAFISFTIGAAIDALFPYGFVIARIILITSSIEFYGGFILPDWMRKIFIKQE
ncbi:MAG: hypothetical protein ACTSVV_06200 [Promethearchaeota archaeon]